MGKIMNGLFCVLIVLEIALFTAYPELPVMIWTYYGTEDIGPPPAPLPKKWQHTPQFPNPPEEPKPQQPPVQPTRGKLIWC